MTFNELYKEYTKMCDKQDCDDCKYNGKFPCQLAYGYDKGIADFKKSEEYCQEINEAFNNGIDVGKRDLMKDALIIKAKADAIEPIKQIINDYEEGKDLWEGMDSEYVISRIIEQLKGEME